MDYGVDGDPIRIFESASIVMYFAEKFGRFIPSDPRQRVEMNNWVFWQMSGQGPITGNFGHFFVYAPSDKVEARDYGVARYGMDTLRLTDVLEKHLEDKQYMLGDEYSVVDMICFPWFHQLRTGYIVSKHAIYKLSYEQSYDIVLYNLHLHVNLNICFYAFSTPLELPQRIFSRLQRNSRM